MLDERWNRRVHALHNVVPKLPMEQLCIVGRQEFPENCSFMIAPKSDRKHRSFSFKPQSTAHALANPSLFEIPRQCLFTLLFVQSFNNKCGGTGIECYQNDARPNPA